MAKINKRFCKLTNEQFIAQRGGEGFEKYTIVFISDTKKIWHDGIEYGANDAEIGEVIQTLIVNDLTTGGTDKALSAEQGKQLKTLVDQINTEIEAGNEYTVNGHKISENPVLNGADIALTGFTELPEETVNEALKPAATDTVNQATAKLYKAIIDNEEVVASAFAELIKSVGLDEHLKYVNKPGDLTASDIAGVIAEINTKVNNIKTQYDATKSDYEAFKAQFDWYEGE